MGVKRIFTKKRGGRVPQPPTLLGDLRAVIRDSQKLQFPFANAGLTLVYWQIGERIRQEVPCRSSESNDQIIADLAHHLEREFGRGYDEKNLRRMVHFTEVFPDREMVVSLMQQLTWTHFVALIPLKNPLEREFYAEMCRLERWSVRTLRARIESLLFERTALSKKPHRMISQHLRLLREENHLNPDLVFRDPYVLDFLELKDTYSEKDLENAILREMESFLLELGAGFAFIARQKRITLDGDDYYIDLLFFHRNWKRLVAIELKLTDFRPGDAGQMELYLRWLNRHARQPGEESPIGLILCAGKKRDTVELLDLTTRGIHVAEYLTRLPQREWLENAFRGRLFSPDWLLRRSMGNVQPLGTYPAT